MHEGNKFISNNSSVGKTAEKRPFRIHKSRREDKINTDLVKI